MWGYRTMAEKKTRDKKFHSINGRIYILIFILTLVTAAIGTLNTSRLYIDLLDSTYQEKSVEISSANAITFYRIELGKLGHMLLSEEFQELRKSGALETNADAVWNYIEKKDPEVFEFVYESTGIIAAARESYSVDNIYIVSKKKEGLYFLLGGYDDWEKFGMLLPFTFDETNSTQNRKWDNVFTKVIERPSSMNTQFEEIGTTTLVYLSFSPIGDGDEENNYYLVVEKNLEEVGTTIFEFYKNRILFTLLLTAVLSLIGVLIIRRYLTDPVIKITKSAVKFRDENSASSSAEPIDPGIRSRNELGDLSDSLYSLEKNVRATQEELKGISEEKGRVDAELSIASGIQHGVLPTDFLEREEADIFALMDPARKVGGDFYDFFMIDDDNLALLIGDVSDKGIAAALFMMTAKTALRLQAQTTPVPSAVLQKVNDLLCQFNPKEMFVTVWIGILNLKTGVLTAANAGHEYPLLSLGGRPFEVMNDDPHGIVLGSFPGLKYKDYEVVLAPGDRLAVYTDGATDAEDPAKRQVGLDGLIGIVRESAAEQSAEGFVKEIRRRIAKFAKDAVQFDDITLLSVTFRKPSEK